MVDCCLLQSHRELAQSQMLPDQKLGLKQHWAALLRQRVQESLSVQAPTLVVHQALQAASRLHNHQQLGFSQAPGYV